MSDSARRAVRARIVEIITAELPGVAVFADPPADDRPLLEAVWVEKVTSRFEHRGLGPNAPRRETVRVLLRADAYRIAETSPAAAREAREKSEELIEAIEDAIAADLSLGTRCADALVAETSTTAVPQDAGWLSVGTCRIDVSNYPPIP